MPELPEVETVRRGLVPVMEGQVIARAEVNRADLRWPFPPGMAARLSGQRVERLRRRSKYILADLSGGETLLVHLGMSGRMLISGVTDPHPDPNPHPNPPPSAGEGDAPAPGVFYLAQAVAQKHDHVVLTMAGGARVIFNDARRFGAMDLMPTATSEAHWLLAGLGPEPLGNVFNEIYLADRLRGRQTPVKSALLDQRVVAGLGNIYVCEVLYRAGISPVRRAGNLSRVRAARLVPIIREVLTEAIDAGGSSLRDYRQTDGELGYFQHTFRVYGREGLPCLTPGCAGTVRRVVQSGRSSFYCPACQH